MEGKIIQVVETKEVETKAGKNRMVAMVEEREIRIKTKEKRIKIIRKRP